MCNPFQDTLTGIQESEEETTTSPPLSTQHIISEFLESCKASQADQPSDVGGSLASTERALPVEPGNNRDEQDPSSSTRNSSTRHTHGSVWTCRRTLPDIAETESAPQPVTSGTGWIGGTGVLCSWLGLTGFHGNCSLLQVLLWMLTFLQVRATPESHPVFIEIFINTTITNSK